MLLDLEKSRTMERNYLESQFDEYLSDNSEMPSLESLKTDPRNIIIMQPNTNNTIISVIALVIAVMAFVISLFNFSPQPAPPQPQPPIIIDDQKPIVIDDQKQDVTPKPSPDDPVDVRGGILVFMGESKGRSADDQIIVDSIIGNREMLSSKYDILTRILDPDDTSTGTMNEFKSYDDFAKKKNIEGSHVSFAKGGSVFWIVASKDASWDKIKKWIEEKRKDE